MSRTSTVTMADTSFPFVVSNGPKVPKEARTMIRKQAMRDVGIARKKRGTYGRINLHQTLPYSESPEEGDFPIRSAVGAVSGSGSGSSGSQTCTPDVLDFDEVIPRPREGDIVLPSPFLAGLSTQPLYERARLKFGVDIVSLSILTNFNVGKSTIAILSADPTRLASILGQQQCSYLEYVPSRYGLNECLTTATNVLLAKVHQVLAPKSDSQAFCNRLYGKALRSLQDALASESSVMDPDVLCATQLLSLHELLDPARDTAWSQHVQGSARLVRHRSVTRFETEYERALFAAHVGGIVSESLVNNTHCYLEQSEWIDLYTSLIQETQFLTDRSALAIKARVAMFVIPGLWHDVGEAVNDPSFLEDAPTFWLEARCRKAHKDMLDWLDQYKSHCVRLSLAQPPALELALRRELFGSVMECLAIIKRLLATVSEADRRPLEVETQALAHLILDLQKQPSPKHSWLFSGHEVGVAYTVLLTKDQWEEDVSRKEPEERKLAIRMRYNTWSNTLRMTG